MDGFKGERSIVMPNSVQILLQGNEITRQLYITAIGYYPSAKYHYREREVGLQEYILLYSIDGNGWVVCDGEKHEISSNHLFIIPKGVPHSYGASLHNPWTIIWIHFRGDSATLFESIYGRVISIPYTADSRLLDRFQLFEDMLRNLEMGFSRENMEYITYCLSYFLSSIKYLQQYRAIKNVKPDDTVQRCILYMKENLEHRITLEDIATHVGYSPSHLTTLFTQKTSFSPMSYYNHLRIQRSCSFLQFSDMKIKEIAFRLGYFDPFHFSKAFYKEMGITPKEYRKQNKEK